jgi:hypothetical protein
MVTCLDFLKNGFDFKAFYVLKKSGVAINYCRVNKIRSCAIMGE